MDKDKLRYAMLKEIEKNEKDMDFQDFGAEQKEFYKQAIFF